jgi:hypothetical protein
MFLNQPFWWIIENRKLLDKVTTSATGDRTSHIRVGLVGHRSLVTEAGTIPIPHPHKISKSSKIIDCELSIISTNNTKHNGAATSDVPPKQPVSTLDP